MTGLQNNAVADNAGAGSDSIGSQPHIGTLQRMVPYVSFAFVMTPASFKQKANIRYNDNPRHKQQNSGLLQLLAST